MIGVSLITLLHSNHHYLVKLTINQIIGAKVYFVFLLVVAGLFASGRFCHVFCLVLCRRLVPQVSLFIMMMLVSLMLPASLLLVECYSVVVV